MAYHLRIARPVRDLLRTAEMYRRGLGLHLVGSFQGHAGFDGVMLGVPDGAYHFEFTRSPKLEVPAPSREDLAVLYVPDPDEWAALCGSMLAAGFKVVASFNPYWDVRGRTFEDADGFRTVTYTYVGSELTWPIYWHGTLGKAKEDLDRAAAAIRKRLGARGDARVAALKAVVTPASSAIPVVPLYASLLFKVMKERNAHETVIEHIDRLFRGALYSKTPPPLDEVGRIRHDAVELSDAIQGEVKRRWPIVTTENLAALADFDGFRADFLKIFGFGFAGVDYDEDLDPALTAL